MKLAIFLNSPFVYKAVVWCPIGESATWTLLVWRR